MSSSSFDIQIPLNVTLSLGKALPGNADLSGAAAIPQRLPRVPTGLGQGVTLRSPLEGRFSSQPIREDFTSHFSLEHFNRREASWTWALNAALCSNLAYSSDSQIRDVARRWSLDTVRVIKRNETECFVASTDDTVLVSFRGTQETRDWLINLNVATKRTPYGYVHRGFYFAFHDVTREIEREFDNVNADNKRVVLAGHSLGGALATIGAAEWHGRQPIAAVYTFGQPAVGFTALRSMFRISYPNSFFRFVNDDDVVPQVPPGYRHVGKLFHFDEDGSVGRESTASTSLADFQDTPTMSDASFEQLKRQLAGSSANFAEEGFLPSVADHAMDRYIGKIVRNANDNDDDWSRFTG